MKITIKGRPVPYVRTTQKAKYVSKSYKRYYDYKLYVQTILKSAYKSPPLEDYIHVTVNVFLCGKTAPMGRDGDIDNYIKSILDSANKILFKDDRQVISIEANKIKSNDERVEIEFYEVYLDEE